jgi:dTDP-4-dehydrorhamnose reductase
LIDLSKVLIIGKDSTIGQELDFGIKLGHKDLDITNLKDVEIIFSKYSPQAVICLASVDLASSESNPAMAMNVNVNGFNNVIKMANKYNSLTILISSGAVFNGNSNGFTELDIPNPINVYGKTKYLAEILLKNSSKNYLIIRTGWLFGIAHKKNGFTKFIDKLLNEKNEGEIIATYDSFGSPTYIKDFVNELKRLIISNQNEVIHLVNEGYASAADVAKECVLLTGKNLDLKLISYKTLSNSSQRSQSEALISKNNEIRNWKIALKDYLSEIKKTQI